MKMIFATLLLALMSTSSFAKVDKKKAKAECRAELSMERGESPTKEQRKSMRACLEKKGVKVEKRERKKADEKKLKAMKECREKLGLTKTDPSSKKALRECLQKSRSRTKK